MLKPRLYKFIGNILFLVLLLICTICNSQVSPKKDFVLSAEGHYGYVISHRGNMAHLIKGHISGGELTYTFRTCGNKPWQWMYDYPEFGVSAMHLYLANPAQLGNLDAVYPFMNLRMNNPKKKYKMYIRLGFGLAWISKPFDRLTNHQNNSIGSYLNGFVNLRYGSSFMLSKAWRLDAGVGLSHASNGAIRTPNLGLNMATVNVGVGYVFGNKSLEMKCDSVYPKIDKRWHKSVIGVFGVKELEHPLGNKYMSYALIGNIYYSATQKNRFGTGVELIYSNANRKYLENDSVSTEKVRDVMKVGVKLGYAFHIDRLSVPIDFGVYAFQNRRLDDLFFHRIGLRYMVTKHVMANVTLYTHWAKADYFEWGVGYEF